MGMSVCVPRIFPSVLQDPALHPTHIVTYSVFPQMLDRFPGKYLPNS